ncbi:hypothetical protein AVEN_184030-1 [Araneus ventricosus]|uniref:Retrotransposon gag domain-containing protein n=1 Tax=Araneus ventricosus TaxID=182803 RepID=A0A4Y2GWX0_ARAVE|nr:hypothetical protein AVEN_184030-1 [Araneus ventricosus]
MVEGDTEAKETPPTPSPSTYITYQLPREPCCFSGLSTEDAEKWKNDYERIANYNHWDDSVRLANVVFYLSGTARLWFDNNEDQFKNWSDFERLFEETFGRPEDLKSFAEGLLRTRAQRPGETYESYIQDVLSLCRRIDKSMTEDQKVSHLMKGVAEDLYQVLINREVCTVHQFVTCCRQVDAMKDLSDLIRRIVREEIQKVLPQIATCTDDGPDGLESIIREEVRSTLAPLTRNEPAPSPYTTKRRTDQSFWRPRQRLQQDGRRNLQDVGRKTNLWRTSDNVPICFHSGRPGHVTRYCRDRRRVFNEARVRRQSDQYQSWDSDSVSDVGRDPESNYQRYRSASPYPRRNPQRRQSRSPARRSPIRSSEEN